MTMLKKTAWIGVGANLGEPRIQVLEAIDCLDRIDKIAVDVHSSLYRTAPIEAPDQPDFINAVVRVTTTLDPLSMLHCLLQIEEQFGRMRDRPRNSPRRLDLDLLLFENEIRSSKELTIPHPRMQQRLFVLQPLMELEGNFEIPGLGSLAICINACQGQRVTKLVDSDGKAVASADS
jgi:2-amino-4-hydroxy-6-hydroxymethyldihydropteridine diphosphokinase